jgi:outer membrane receptor for ferrienterochelin and colicins
LNIKILLVVIQFSLFIVNFAQSGSIRGKVTDSNGTPLPGANVIVLGKMIGTSTDNLGNYLIPNLNYGNFRIEVSLIGYKNYISDSLHLTGSSYILNITLTESAILSEQVVITAGKHEQTISELPVSASIMSSKDIMEKNVSSLDYAIRYAPGVTMNLDQISIRGSSGYSRGAGTRVLVAMDGIPLYTGDTGEIIWEIIPVTEVSRIEIIKGASSSLYGSTAIGGVINVITKDISSQSFSYFKSYFGSYDKPSHKEWDWSGKYRTFNGQTLTHSDRIKNFGFTLSASRTENLGYRQNDFFKRFTGFLKTSYQIDNENSLIFFANGLTQNRGNFLYWRDSRHALQPPEADLSQRVISDRYMLGIIYQKIFNPEFFLNVRTSYYNTHWRDETASMDNSRAQLFRGEVQSTYKIQNNIFLVSGIEATAGKVNSNIFSSPKSHSFGLYTQLEYKFPFPLTITAGARYDYNKLDSLNSTGDFSPKIGLNYKLSPNTIFRASAGKGYRAPTLAEGFTRTSASGITIEPNPYLKPEHNYSFELGINRNFENSITLDAALFQNEYYDYIETAVDPKDGLIQFTNLTRARIQGLELNLEVNLIPNILKFNSNYVYLWARDIEKNKPLKYRPRNLFYSTLDLTIDKWEFGSDFRFWSRIEELDLELVDLGIVPDGDKRVPVYVWDLRSAYNTSLYRIPIKISLNANNVLNYNYIEIIGNLSPIRNFCLSLEVVL